MQTTRSDHETARAALSDLVFGARTLADVERAERALRQWLLDYPEEQGMRDGFELLSHKRDFAEWRAENPELAKVGEARRRVSNLTYAADTLDKTLEAREALRLWLCEHPEDDMASEAGFLAIMEQTLHELAEEGEDARMGQETARVPAHV